MEITENEIFIRLGGIAQECYFAFNVVENKPVYIGKAFEKLTGLTMASIHQNISQIWETVHADDRTHVQKALKSLLRSGRVTTEFRILEDGTTRYLQLNAYDIGNNLIAGQLTDITGLKNNIFYAEKINARKNAMLAVLAHDLKEPVGVINMMASAIKRNPAVTGNEDVLTHIKVIQELCARNIALINDLMNKEFLESPDVGLRKERTNMNNALADIVNQYKSSEAVVEKDFKFVQPAHIVYADVDMLKIAQCVNNLLVNAIKFTPAGRQVTVQLTEKENSVVIAVADEGIGIPANLQPYLFEERTRAHRKGLRGEQGYGMGLSIIRLLVELHGGKVWAESLEGKGSTFYMELPK